MEETRITVRTGPYDRIEALRYGAVKADGLSIDYGAQFPVHDIFVAMAERQAYDASEMSLALYLTRRARGDFPLRAIPVFPSRVFRHGNIFVNAAAKIAAPRDLEGKRVGIQEYRQTAAIWVRGILRDEYGVNTEAIRWVEGGVNSPRHATESDVRPLRAVAIDALAEGDTLSAALAAGRIDAVIAARTPDSFGSGGVARLFPDYRRQEQDYFRRTGIFPIMHTFVIREALLDDKPWIAKSLFRAFEQSKAQAIARMRYTGAMTYMTPWLQSDLEEVDAVFGGDPWVYGLEPNRVQLETFLRYLTEEGFLAARPRVDDLFVPVTD